MKKVLALVLAFAMVFSTVTVAFAEGEVSEEAKALATLGMLEGDGSGVTVEYTSKQLTRLSAAAALLKLKGLYEEAVAFEGEDNFADVKDYAWAEGRNLMAYLKANPGLGFGGDENGNFNPGANIDEKSYYKVLLETLGYKQTTADVAGDFAWEEVLTFAESVGLKPVNAETFTVDALAKATVSALKANTKEGKAYVETLVEAGKLTEEVAVAAGVMEEAPEVTVAVDSAEALGNTVVEVVFEDDVDAEALENADYAIEDLDVEEVVVTGTDTVRLTTEAMTAGKLYTLTVGEDKVKFTGISKKSGAPVFEKAVSEDIEEVVLTFDKNLDFESATDPANYTISGVEVVEAEVDENEVTLTTNGLVARKQYTVRASNIESVDGGLLKGSSKSFYTRFDTTPPKVEDVDVETNQRIVVTFSEEVTKESAEDLSNYTITQGDTELAVLDAVWDDDDEDNVTLTTEAQTVNKKYELEIANIVDQTKAGNVMTKAVKKTFYGKREDTAAPSVDSKVEVIARNLLKVTFKDASMIDEASALDPNNYELEKSKDDFVVETVEKISSVNGEFVALLYVEDLNVGTYTLKINNIADEFGNTIDSEVRRTVNVTRDGIASATIEDVSFDDENTITLTFTKPLKEETAEDVANYSIDNDINTPISATYDDENDVYTVELETEDLTVGVKYDITVDGVEDLAGNILSLEWEDALATGDWEEDAPELEDVYVLNKYVLALAFDQEVDVDLEGNDVYVSLDAENEDGEIVEQGIKLYARALSEDDMVVEFSNYIDEDNAEDLDPDYLYTIKDFVGNVFNVSDVAFDETSVDFTDYQTYGSDEDPEYAEVLNISQINGTQFEVIMSKNVLVKDGVTEVEGLEIEVDDDVVTLTKKTGSISDDNEYEIDFSTVLTDEHGIPVINIDDEDTTVFYGEYEDEDGPYIVNVVAVDRFTVEVEYNEDIDDNSVGTNTFSVKNSDEDVSKTDLVKSVEVDENIVTITLKYPLEGRYDYKLIVEKDGAAGVKDLAGNKAEEEEDDEFYFNGTDLAPIDDASYDEKAVEEEATKYMTSVTIEADDEDVTNNVYFDLAQLKANKEAADDVTVVVKVDETCEYLDDASIDGTSVALKALPDDEAEETVVLEFSKDDAKTTLEVTVTIKKVAAQD